MQHRSQHVILLAAITVDDYFIHTAPFILIPVLEKKGNAVRPFTVSKGSGDNLLSEEILQEPETSFVEPTSSQLAPSIPSFRSFSGTEHEHRPLQHRLLDCKTLLLNQVRQEFSVGLAEELVAFARQPRHTEKHLPLNSEAVPLSEWAVCRAQD